MTDISTVPTIQLLAELVRREPPAPAPSKIRRFGPWQEHIIPIGRDHHASLALDKEAADELKELTETVRFADTDALMRDLKDEPDA